MFLIIWLPGEGGGGGYIFSAHYYPPLTWTLLALWQGDPCSATFSPMPVPHHEAAAAGIGWFITRVIFAVQDVFYYTSFIEKQSKVPLISSGSHPGSTGRGLCQGEVHKLNAHFFLALNCWCLDIFAPLHVAKEPFAVTRPRGKAKGVDKPRYGAKSM